MALANPILVKLITAQPQCLQVRYIRRYQKQKISVESTDKNSSTHLDKSYFPCAHFHETDNYSVSNGNASSTVLT